MTKWVSPIFGRGQVDKAGAILLLEAAIEADAWDNALVVINNWRSAHSYPLQALKMTLLHRSKKVDDRAIVAQRLKRLSSIELKLRRNKHMALSQMQDIGGCRTVVRSVTHVDRLVKLYEHADSKNPNVRPEFSKKFDYISTPKKDGYRGIHLIYKYRSIYSSKRPWNGLRIEIQLRSRLQHAWATAVETVDIFTAQTLKTGGGIETWRRFFVLMGTAIARRERRPPCPSCPEDPAELKRELRDSIHQLKVRTVLRGWSEALRMTRYSSRMSGVYLLYLDTDLGQVNITGFPNSQRARASEEYLSTEKMIKDKPSAQAVLVSVESLQSLKSAFPNYFADTRVFLDAMDQAISRN